MKPLFTWRLSIPPISFGFAVLAASAASAETLRDCTNAEALEAESAVASMSSWPRLHEGFVLYGHCDDGTIAEGFSDKVEQLLIERWPTVGDFAAVSLADPRFEVFVLRHIDFLMSRENGQALVTSAEQECPAAAKQFCIKLVERVTELHREADMAKADKR